ncbi:glycine oxidase ThiO [Candidatus Laterigemmans baculatus]|uniref:glycine oxidase ThiO n=1 Tax=Candidatus Laterigemmans baculatus TaxID=2770505 RepID=UPI0013DD836E|nr:glycine oxidase ThiO [Candidatus Laterigemmans baculatus]
MTTPLSDHACIVVGGGVIGLSIAWELALRGVRSLVLERGRLGRGTSWAGAGILPPANFQTALDPLDRLRGLSHALHREWAERIRRETGIDTGYRACGGIYLARGAGEAASLQGLAQYWREYEIRCEPLDAESLGRREPALADALRRAVLRSAWWVPDEVQIRPPDHLRGLAAAAAQAGVEFREQTPVERLVREGSRVVGVETAQGPITADTVILAGGVWASALNASVHVARDLIPVRGQVVLYRAAPGLLHSVINEGHRYLVPRDDGHIYTGSNEEEVGLDERTTPEVIASLREWAETLVPELRRGEVERTWSGLRPGTIDGFPYLGRAPDFENLYVATGHFRSGLHLSCGTAVVIADLVTGRTPAVNLDAFRPAR